MVSKKSELTAQATPWFCKNCWRMEDKEGKTCPKCGTSRQRVSRYEWFLADALDETFTALGRQFEINEQWAVPDHRGFSWHFDLRVSVAGKQWHSELIEVNGSDHDSQPIYGGDGGGYTRDYDKGWEAKKHRHEIRIVSNDDCRLHVVSDTARIIADEMIGRADDAALINESAKVGQVWIVKTPDPWGLRSGQQIEIIRVNTSGVGYRYRAPNNGHGAMTRSDLADRCVIS